MPDPERDELAGTGMSAGRAHPWVDPECTTTDDPLDRDRYRAHCGCGWQSDKLRRIKGMAAHDYAQHERAARTALRASGAAEEGG